LVGVKSRETYFMKSWLLFWYALSISGAVELYWTGIPKEPDGPLGSTVAAETYAHALHWLTDGNYCLRADRQCMLVEVVLSSTTKQYQLWTVARNSL
jgi:hypothetical protein